jgi:hypothetical protein
MTTNVAASYFEHLTQQFLTGQITNEIISKYIIIGQDIVQFNFLGNELMPVFFSAFRHLEVTYDNLDSSPALIINLWDRGSTGIGIKSPPWIQTTPHHLGLIETYTYDSYFTLQQPGSGAVYMFDEKIKTAFYYVPVKGNIPIWESDFPFRMIFHWHFKNTPFQPVHSAAIGNAKGGIILAGKGGSGKSTTTLSCINSTLKIAGDDYVLLDTSHHVAYSLFHICKITRNSLELLSDKSFDPNTLSEPNEGKFRISLFDNFRKDLIRSVTVKAIVLPEITNNRATDFEPCSNALAMMALAPTTLFQLPGLREHAFEKMSKFVRQIPAYHLRLGQDIDTIPDVIDELIVSISS